MLQNAGSSDQRMLAFMLSPYSSTPGKGKNVVLHSFPFFVVLDKWEHESGLSCLLRRLGEHIIATALIEAELDNDMSASVYESPRS
jgi:hypothetical protein